MDVSFMPSLERLACERIVMLLLSDSDLQWGNRNDYFPVKSAVIEKISQLMPCALLRRKLENVVAPVMFEVQNWIEFCEKNWTGMEVGCFRVRDAVPLSRMRDGSIDKKKFVTILVRNNDISPLTRFILACIFCRFEDILDLWNSLLKIEKAYLRHRSVRSYENSDSIIRQWIDWLDISTDKNWKSFVEFAFETPLWKSNVYMLKHVLQTFSPVERSEYLLKALTGGQVSNEMMRYCLLMTSVDDREVILREYPLAVFKCLLSWPLRSVFLDFSIKLWPYVTKETFCRILVIILKMIRDECCDYVDLIIILKNFWAQSPDQYKEFAENESVFVSVNFILKYDFSQQFQRSRLSYLITRT